MAKQTVKSGLAAKLGDAGRKAVAAHKDDEVDLGFGGDLPPGIEGGVAQLTRCWFDQYKEGKNKGEYYMMAMGTVIEPVEFVDGLSKEVIHCEGRQTKIGPLPICQTEKRGLDENIGRVLNELRKLGVDTSGLELDDLESTVEQLQSEAPYFRFRTWIGKATPDFPNPTTQHDWKGVTTFEGQPTDDVQEVNTNSDGGAPFDAQSESSEASGGEVDLSALGAAGDSGDEDAIAQLTSLCDAAGINPDDIETWSKVATMLAGDGGGEATAPAGDFTPEVGQVYYFKPPKAKKAVECEVTAVFDKSKKVNIKNLDDGKTIYKSIAYDALAETAG